MSVTAKDDYDPKIVKEWERIRKEGNPFRKRTNEDNTRNFNDFFYPDKLFLNYLDSEDSEGKFLRSLPYDINKLKREDIKELPKEIIFGTIDTDDVLREHYNLDERNITELHRVIKKHMVRGLIKEGKLNEDEIKNLGYEYNGLTNPTPRDIIDKLKENELHIRSMNLKCEERGIKVKPAHLILRDTCPYMKEHETDEGIYVEESKGFPIVDPVSIPGVKYQDSRVSFNGEVDVHFQDLEDIVWEMTNVASNMGLIGAEFINGQRSHNEYSFEDFEGLTFPGKYGKLKKTIINCLIARKIENVAARNDIANNKWRLSNIIYNTNLAEGDELKGLDLAETFTLYEIGLANYLAGWTNKKEIRKKNCDKKCTTCDNVRCQLQKAGGSAHITEKIPGYVSPESFARYKDKGISERYLVYEALDNEERLFQALEIMDKYKKKGIDPSKTIQAYSKIRNGLIYYELDRRFNIIKKPSSFDALDYLRLHKYKDK